MLGKGFRASGAVYRSHKEFLEKMNRASGEDFGVELKRLAFLVRTKVYLFYERRWQ